MTQNMTDKEEVEMLKEWWNKYGKMITVAVAIGLIIGFGWRYWRQHEIKQVNEASFLFERLGIADQHGQPKMAVQIASKLMTQYDSTPYATTAALWLMRQSVDDKNYAPHSHQ